MKTVNLQTAKALVDFGYTKPTPYIWDRHNPQTREGGSPKSPKLAWKISPAKRHYDNECCLRAPTKLRASLFLLKLIVTGKL